MNFKIAITFIMVGMLSGWVASKAMGERSAGASRSLGIGVVGAVIGGFLAHLFGIHSSGILGNLVVAFSGSVLLLLVLRQIR